LVFLDYPYFISLGLKIDLTKVESLGRVVIYPVEVTSLGKSKRSDKEYTREQKLAKENRQLKRELAHLRKQISRLDLEGLEAAKQVCLEQEERDRINEVLGEPSASLDRLKEIWTCNDCRNGWLEITLYSKCGQTWYFRICSNDSCKKRTKGQRYDEKSVKGIIKK
jgi:hypothetical protein